jgi:hypothetical protein
MLVKILIVFFLILITYQIFLAISGTHIFEGLDNNNGQTYQPYNPNDPNAAMILAQQNAGNIEYLKQRVTDLSRLQEEVTDISKNVIELNSQVTTLVQQQASAATQLAGNKPADISGATS